MDGGLKKLPRLPKYFLTLINSNSSYYLSLCLSLNELAPYVYNTFGALIVVVVAFFFVVVML